MSGGWIYQGRQEHGWFGHGTKPDDGSSASEAEGVGSLEERIHALGYTLIAGLPASKRYHAAARLTAEDHARLDRVMEGVARAVPLGPRVTAMRVLDAHPDGLGVAEFVEAGRIIAAARTRAEMREATDRLAAGVLAMGLDRFLPFLRQADAHLTSKGGLLTLVRDMPVPQVAPAGPRPIVAPPSPPSPPRPVGSPPGRAPLPPAGQLVPLLLRTLGGVGVAAGVVAALNALAAANRAGEVRAAMERFGLDPAKAADVAAAVAYVWALSNRSLLQPGPFGPTIPEAAQGAIAEGVMRAVRADPTLLDRVMAGDAGALGVVRGIVAAVASGVGIVTRDREEAELVDRLRLEGKSGAEIQEALDEHRRRAGTPSRLDLPADPDQLVREGWVETTHPMQAARGLRRFRNPETGEELHFDRGTPGKFRYQTSDHYHRPNPQRTSKRDEYLDYFGNPVPNGSKPSHIKPTR